MLIAYEWMSGYMTRRHDDTHKGFGQPQKKWCGGKTSG